MFSVILSNPIACYSYVKEITKCNKQQDMLKMKHTTLLTEICEPGQVIVKSTAFICNWTLHSVRQTRQRCVPFKCVRMVSLKFKIRSAISSTVVTDEDDFCAAVHGRWVVAIAVFVHQLQHAIIVRQLPVGNAGIVGSVAAKHHAQQHLVCNRLRHNSHFPGWHHSDTGPIYELIKLLEL